MYLVDGQCNATVVVSDESVLWYVDRQITRLYHESMEDIQGCVDKFREGGNIAKNQP